MRNDQVARIYSIVNLLDGAPHGLTVNEITDRVKERGFAVTRRTIYRDLQALHQSGFPLYERDLAEDKSVRWTLEQSTRINQYLMFSVKELIALYLSRSILASFRETSFFDGLKSAFEKIKDKLGARQQEFVEGLSQDMKMELLPKWGLGAKPEVIETIRSACSESHKLSITYQRDSASESSERMVGPHCLYFAKGSLYLLCEDFKDKKIKTFSLPRIQSAVMLPESYDQSKVDPEKHFAGSFGTFRGERPEQVELQFMRDVAPYIREQTWHQSQQLTDHADGSVSLSLKVAITPDLVSWVLGFGTDVSILAPDNLKNLVCERAAEVVRHYDSAA